MCLCMLDTIVVDWPVGRGKVITALDWTVVPLVPDWGHGVGSMLAAMVWSGAC